MEEDIIIGNELDNTLKMYLFVFNGWDAEDAKTMLNDFLNKDIIGYWRTDMYHTFYITSKLHIDKVRDKIHEHIDSLRFLLVEMKNCSGWIPKEGWEAINKFTKKSKPLIVQETDSGAGEEVEI